MSLETKQLRNAYDQATKGMWVFVEQPDGYGLFCNEHVLAEKMSSEDAYLVDTMHAHFKPMLDTIDQLAATNLRLKESEDALKLQIESLKRQVNHWHGLYNSAKAAGERIIQETK